MSSEKLIFQRNVHASFLILEFDFKQMLLKNYNKNNICAKILNNLNVIIITMNLSL